MKSTIAAIQIERKEQIAQVVKDAEQKQEHFVWNLLDEMKWLHDEARVIYEAAKGTGDYSAAAKALGEARQQMKLFSELLVGHDPGQAEKLEAEWILLREAIFVALERHPDALLDVMGALLALKSNHDYQSNRQLLPEGTTEQPDSDG